MAPRQPKPPQLQCLAAAAAGAARHPAAGPGGRAGHEAHFLVAEHLRRIGRYDPDRRDALALQPCCDGAGLGGGIDHQAAPCADAAWPGPAGAAGPDRCAADRSDRVAARWRVLEGLGGLGFAALSASIPQLCSRPALSRDRAAISCSSARSSRAADTGAAVVITRVRLWERHHLKRNTGSRATSRAMAQKNT